MLKIVEICVVLLPIIVVNENVRSYEIYEDTSDLDCGVHHPLKRENQFFKDERVRQLEFPWKAAIYHKQRYVCGGVLVSKLHVVTASDCVYHHGKNSLEEFLVVLGAHDLSNQRERGKKVMRIRKIWMKIFDGSASSTSGISILELFYALEYSDLVKPVCMGGNEIRNMKDGIVAGWNAANVEHSKTPVKVDFYVLNDGFCPISKTQPLHDSFCAVRGDANEICEGEIGSGFYVEINGKFHLKGIASSPQLKSCSESHIKTFIDIAKYHEFLLMILPNDTNWHRISPKYHQHPHLIIDPRRATASS